MYRDTCKMLCNIDKTIDLMIRSIKTNVVESQNLHEIHKNLHEIQSCNMTKDD